MRQKSKANHLACYTNAKDFLDRKLCNGNSKKNRHSGDNTKNIEISYVGNWKYQEKEPYPTYKITNCKRFIPTESV